MDAKLIGETAGLVWRALGAQGKLAVGALAKALDKDAALVQMAVGWLAREHKVDFEKQGKTLTVRLTPAEAEAFKSHSGK